MPRDKKIRIMVFGTFDVIHPGHLHFFRQARALARSPARPYLIVSVARDVNVKRIKGRAARRNERQRLQAIKELSEKVSKTAQSNSPKIIDKAVLGGLRDHLPHIIRERPDIIALGHDQVEYTRGLRAALKRLGLNIKIVRLKPFRRGRYRSSLWPRPAKAAKEPF